ncbi:MAG: MBL fold metallo-hydrolase [Desulfatibacillaceae bacterium]
MTPIQMHPRVAAYRHHFQTPVQTRSGKPPPTPSLIFLGANSLIFRDGDSTLLVDPYFTRVPGVLSPMLLFRKQSPSLTAITRTLAAHRLGRADAVAVTHSHFDHAMDAPDVARLLRAPLYGSASTANVARGRDLPEHMIRPVPPGGMFDAGDFRVTFLPGRHLRFPPHLQLLLGRGTEIAGPLRPPCRATEYREGGCYTLLVEHSRGRAIVQGSAGFIPGALDGVRADTAILGIGGLDMKSEAYMREYYEQSVEAVGADCVYLTHWDNFALPLDQPVRWLKHAHRSVDFFLEAAKGSGKRVRLLPLACPVPLPGLSGPARS